MFDFLDIKLDFLTFVNIKIKGTVQRDFQPPVFFIIQLIFSNLISFSPRYSKFSIEKTYSAQYHTALSQKEISS